MLTELLIVVALHGTPISQASFVYNTEVSCQLASRDLSYVAAPGYSVTSKCHSAPSSNASNMSGDGTAVVLMAFDGSLNIGGYQIGSITKTHLQCVTQTTSAQKFFNDSERSWVSLCIPRII